MQVASIDAMRKRRFAVALLVGVLAAGSSEARKKAGVTMPDEVTLAGHRLVLNGMGLREATVLDIDVYVAGLYVETPSHDPAALVAADEPKVLVLRFKRDVGRDDIVKAWREGFQKNATVPLAQLQPSIDQLVSWTPAFSKGDTLTFSYLPAKGVMVDHNGKRLGTLPGGDFSRSLFSIWLGPKPPTSALKRGLLGS